MAFAFILESIGTWELVLIGIVALVFLGPRKLPEIARKIGKLTAEFRGTASEFKETWQREVDFESERKLLDLNNLDDETAGSKSGEPAGATPAPTAPSIRELDADQFDEFARQARSNGAANGVQPTKVGDEAPALKKENWL